MLSQNELMLRGAQVRLQELTQEVRDLLHHFPSLPRVITINVAAETPVEKEKKKGKQSNGTIKRNQTMMESWGTLNVAEIKRMKAKGQKPGEWRRGMIPAKSGSEAVQH